MRKPRNYRRWVILAAAVITVVGVTAGAVFMFTRPEPVSEQDIARAQQDRRGADEAELAAQAAAEEAGVELPPINLPFPPGELGTASQGKKSAREPLPPAVITGKNVEETTDTLIVNFSQDAELFRELSGIGTGTYTVTRDECLFNWAAEALPTFNGKQETMVTRVCDRDAAVLIGGFATHPRDLLLRAQAGVEDSKLKKFAPLADLLFGSTTLRFASAATSDGYGIAIVVTRG